MQIQLTDLTNGTTAVQEVDGRKTITWEGTAIFDVLMKAVNENINVQFEQNRITGSDYATVYLGAITACIQESTNLLIQKAITDKEIEVKQAQILNIQEDTRLKTAQANAFPLQATQELALITEQVLTQKEETELKAAQATAFPLQSAKEIDHKQAQINVLIEDQRLKAAQADVYPDQAAKDVLVKQANVDLINRQKEGFDDNKHQKLFDSQMNAWALMFSSGLLTTKPEIINNDSASALYNTLKPK